MTVTTPKIRKNGKLTNDFCRWHLQTIAWLEADLLASVAALESGSFRQRMAVNKWLGRWQVDPALAGLRDGPDLAGIPESDRFALHSFWNRVWALRAKAAATTYVDGVSSKN